MDGEFVSREGVHFLFKESTMPEAVRPNALINVVLDTYVWVNDVDVIYEELKGRGAKIIFGPVEMEYNMRDLLIEDLYGYR
ncbi:hypothetical protein, partial [Pseudomonas sp. 2995-3]|uniref:hypothetical protein n=1 Tax=Pseudomonas sp. 2995-3 TaxID=1712680 RepID=UPI0034CD7F10